MTEILCEKLFYLFLENLYFAHESLNIHFMRKRTICYKYIKKINFLKSLFARISHDFKFTRKNYFL